MRDFDSKNLRELIRLLERKLELLNKQKGCCSEVSLAQCHALVEIGRTDTISLKELSSILGLDISTVSRTVESLVKKNFVVRYPSKIDRRSVDIKLTDKGYNIFNEIENKMNNDFKVIFNQVPIEELSTVFNGLNIVIEAFSKAQHICSNSDENKY